MRNVICISDMPPDLHEWVKEEARRRGEAVGKRYSVALVFQEALRDLRAKLENNHVEPEPVEVSHAD